MQKRRCTRGGRRPERTAERRLDVLDHTARGEKREASRRGHRGRPRDVADDQTRRRRGVYDPRGPVGHRRSVLPTPGAPGDGDGCGRGCAGTRRRWRCWPRPLREPGRLPVRSGSHRQAAARGILTRASPLGPHRWPAGITDPRPVLQRVALLTLCSSTHRTPGRPRLERQRDRLSLGSAPAARQPAGRASAALRLTVKSRRSPHLRGVNAQPTPAGARTLIFL